MRTKGWEYNISTERAVLGQDKDSEGRARYEERCSIPGKVGKGLSGANSSQILELLLIADIVELVHKGRAPSVELDALHVVDDLVDQTSPGVLILHLRLLQVSHHSSHEALNGHHEEHDNDTSHHGPPHEVVKRDHADYDLERG